MDDLKVALQELKEESDSGRLSGVVDASLPRGRRKRQLIWGGSLIVLIVIAAAVGIPGQGEQDSGVIVKTIPG